MVKNNTTKKVQAWDGQDDHLVLEAMYRWTFRGFPRRVNGCAPSRWLLNSIPDYVIGAELRSFGVLAASRIRSLIGRGLVEDASRAFAH